VRVVFAQRPGGALHDDAADVDRYVATDLRRRFQQQAGLGAGSAAELDQRRILRNEGGDILGDLPQQRRLGAGDVVFRQQADRFEQA
jgi:hypothetical protein